MTPNGSVNPPFRNRSVLFMAGLKRFLKGGLTEPFGVMTTARQSHVKKPLTGN